MAMPLEVYYITCAGMKGLERSVRKGHPKGLGSSSMKSSRNTSPKVWSRLTNLKLSMFTNAEKPWLGKATMDCKAGESKHLLPALVPVLEKMFAGTKKEEEKKMLSAAKSLEKLVALWDEAGTFLIPAEFSKRHGCWKRILAALQMAECMVLGKG